VRIAALDWLPSLRKMTARRAEGRYVIARQEEEIELLSIHESVKAYLLERLGTPFTLTEYSWCVASCTWAEINDAEQLTYRPAIEFLEDGAARASAGPIITARAGCPGGICAAATADS
jgi:hypothetical protein